MKIAVNRMTEFLERLCWYDTLRCCTLAVVNRALDWYQVRINDSFRHIKLKQRI